ncbi:uncharacterized protein LOC123309322 [Coccinella septempunctata]|uniref:uncharacterized protein LOC123309322 n=1 Tax=Coccinella septempunctata TaxID=41139 RepID=UPI001D05C617|nr:uncharacterized protein LOC123309322 [Coccinella septempunctata]
MKASVGPRRLPHILQALEDLGDTQGSSTRRIIDQLESTHYSSTDRPKNLTNDVRKALKYAVDNGIVRERGGKFSVASFYGRKKSSDPSKSIFECRRRRKRGGKRRRRHRRHGSLSSLSDSEASLSGDEWESDRDHSYSRSRSRSPQYTSAGIISHRRRGRGGKRRRRRRGRRHSLNDRQVEASKGAQDGRCLAHHLQDCDNPSCQRNYDKEADVDKHGSYIN